MGLEAAAFIGDFVLTNPVGASDPKSQGDEHIRLIKTALQATFPGFVGRINRVQSKGSTYAVVVNDNCTLLLCSAGSAFDLDFAAAATLGNGFMVIVMNTGTTNVNLDPNGAENINGASTSLIVPPRGIAWVWCDGAALYAHIAPMLPGDQLINPMADATSVTPAAGEFMVNHQANTQGLGTLTVNAPTGPVDARKFIMRIKSTNAHTFSWNAIYRGSTDLALPTAHSGASKTDLFGFIYHNADAKWDMVAYTPGF